MDVDVDYGRQTISVISVIVVVFVFIIYVVFFNNITCSISFSILLLFLIYYIGYFAYSLYYALKDIELGITGPQDRIDIGYYRITVGIYALNTIYLILALLYKCINIDIFNNNAFFIWFILFYIILLFYFNRVFAIQEGYEITINNFWEGIWFGFQSFATGSFFRYIVTSFAYVFATYILGDLFHSVLTDHYDNILCYYPLSIFKDNKYQISIFIFSFLVMLMFINRVNYTWVNPVTEVRDSSYDIFSFVISTGLILVTLNKQRKSYLLIAIILITFLLLFGLSDAPIGYDMITEINNAGLGSIDPGYFGVVFFIIIFISFIVLSTYKNFEIK